MGNTAVRVELTVVIDLSAWANDDEARDDIRNAAAIVFQDWLTENNIYRGASVRVTKV